MSQTSEKIHKEVYQGLVNKGMTKKTYSQYRETMVKRDQAIKKTSINTIRVQGKLSDYLSAEQLQVYNDQA